MSKKIEIKVIDIIIDKLAVDSTKITWESHLSDDLGADSLDIVELILEFEREFDINIPEDQAEGIKTVGDIVTYLDTNLSEEKKIKLNYN